MPVFSVPIPSLFLLGKKKLGPIHDLGTNVTGMSGEMTGYEWEGTETRSHKDAVGSQRERILWEKLEACSTGASESARGLGRSLCTLYPLMSTAQLRDLPSRVCGLDVCTFPKLVCWTVPCVMVSGGGAFGRWVCHEGAALSNGIPVHIKETPESILLLCAMRGHNKHSHLWTRKCTLIWHWICTLILDLQFPELWATGFSCWLNPSLWCSVAAAWKRTQTQSRRGCQGGHFPVPYREAALGLCETVDPRVEQEASASWGEFR